MARPNPIILIGRLVVWGLILGAIVIAIAEVTGVTALRGQLLAYAVENNLLALLIVLYALLLALPFVPGVTLGVAIMIVFGPNVAPVVWLASVCGLTVSFSLARLVPSGWAGPMLLRVGLGDKVPYFDANAHYSDRQRFSGLFGTHPVMQRLAGWRYLALALLVVLPGNVLIGGAGGISLLAGLSRAFQPWKFMLAVGLPMAPLPFAVYFFGIDILPPAMLP